MKMQEVNFRSVEEFLDYLPEDELKITLRLREIVLDCIPNVKEKLAYQVPYYSLKKRICFIWPASVLWGKKQTYTGVRFGFTSGYLLNDPEGYLEKGNRKEVYWRDFQQVSEIDEDMLKAFIFQSVEIDSL
jgi:hypothetical protein